MTTKEKIAIIGLIITALGLVPFSGLLNLIITPNFSVRMDSFIDSDNNPHQGMILDNVGLKQAKNAVAIIYANNPLKIHESQCNEGKITGDNTTQIQIKFERFSQNINCLVDFFSKYTIVKVEVTADDAQGYTWINNQADIERAVQFIIVSLSTLIGVAVVIYTKHKLKTDHNIIAKVGGYASPLKIELVKKYGMGFDDDDEIILRAIHLDKNSIEEIAIFTNLEERYVRQRLNFMEEKEVVYDLSDSWYFDDDGLNRFF